MAAKVKNQKLKKEEVKAGIKTSELKVQIKKAKEELSAMEIDHSQRKLKNTSSLTLKRKEIARLLTAMRQVELHEKNA